MAQRMSPAVRFVNCCRHFGAVRAVDGVTLDIAEGEFFAMLGPSGSGKTTCLRLIAGFEQPDEGRIEIFRRDRRRRAALQAQRQHGVPGLRPLSAYDGRRERCLRPHDQGRCQGRARGESWAALGMVKLGGYEGRRRHSFPAASASAWRSPSALVNNPKVCFSMNRSARST